MRRYETFNPTIPEREELQQVEELPVYEEVHPKNKKTAGGDNSHRKKTETPRTKKKVKGEAKADFFSGVTGFFRSKTLRWLVGLFLALFAVYLGIAFISYFTTCVKDQSEINNTPIGYSADVANAAGEGGARLSEFLINEFFGVGSFVIIVWLLAVGLRMVSGKPRFKPLNFTIKCLVGLITLSLIVGLLTLGFQSSVNWGGYHGRYVNEFIIHFVGWSGAVILCVFMVCCFVGICMRDVVKWILKQRAKYNEKRRIRKKLIEEERQRERELEEMRRAEDRIEGNDTIPSEVNGIVKENQIPLEVHFNDEENLTGYRIP